MDRYTWLERKLQETVRVYADCGMNTSTAARQLGISRQMVNNRINKVKTVTGKDPRNFWDLAYLVGLRRKGEYS